MRFPFLDGLIAALTARKQSETPSLESDTEVARLASALAAQKLSEIQRLTLVQDALELNNRIELPEILALGAARLREALDCQDITISLAEPAGLRVVLAPETSVPGPDFLPSESPGARSFHSREPLITDLRDPGWDPSVVRRQQSQSSGPTLALPLLGGGDLIGVVTCSRPASQTAFTSVDLDLAGLIVPSLATSIRVSRLFTNLRASAASLEEANVQRLKLVREALELNSRVELPEILELGADRLRQALDAPYIIVGLADPDGLRIVLSPADSKTLVLGSLLPSAGPAAHSFASQQTLLADLRSPNWDKDVTAWQQAHAAGPVMSLPLTSAGSKLGVVNCIRRADQDPFDDADRDRAELLLPFVSAAIRVSRLFIELRAGAAELTEATAARLKLVREATELNSRVELPEILELGAERMRQALDAPYVIVALADPDGLRVVLSPDSKPLEQGPLLSSSDPGSRSFVSQQTLIADLRADDGWDETVTSWRHIHEAGPAMSLPLTSAGDQLGVVNCIRRADQDPFDDADRDRAELLLPFVSAAIRVSRLFIELRAGAANLEAANVARLKLVREALELNSRVELPEILELGADRLRSALDAPYIIVALTDSAGLRIVLSPEDSTSFILDSLLPANGPGSQAFASQQTVLADFRDPKWAPEIASWQLAHTAGASMSLPLFSGGDQLGVVTAIRRADQGPFDAADRERAELLLPFVSAAIRVSRSFIDLRAGAAEIEAANVARLKLVREATELNSRVELPEILALGAERMRLALDTPYIIVALTDPAGLRVVLSPDLQPLEQGPLLSPSDPGTRAFASQQTLISDLRTDAEKDATVASWQSLHKAGPAMSLPLTSAGDQLGVVTCIRRADQMPFDAADRERAELLLPFVSAAIRVSRSFIDLRAGAAELEAANLARLKLVREALELNSRVELPEILELGAQRLRSALDAPHIIVAFATPEGLRTVLSPDSSPLEPGPLLPPNDPGTQSFQSQQTLISDLRTPGWDETVVQWQRVHGAGPAMSLPLLSGGDLLGVVTCIRDADQPPFSPSDRDRAELLLPFVSAAIRVSRLFIDLRAGAVELEAATVDRLKLVREATELNSRVELPEILELGAERMRSALDSPYIIVALTDPAGLRVVLSPEDSKTLAPSSLLPLADPGTRSFASQQTLMADLRSPDWAPEVAAWQRAHDAGPSMSLPITSSGDSLGVVTCVRRGEQDAFDDADRDRAELVLPALAAAIRVSRLFIDLRAGAAELEAATAARLKLVREATELNSRVELPEILALGAERLSHALDSPYVTIALTDPAGLRIVLSPDSSHFETTALLPLLSPGTRSFQTQQPLITDLRDEGWDDSVSDFQSSHAAGPTLALPLQSSGDLLGVVICIRPTAQESFTPADLERALLVLPSLSAAIRVSRLFINLRSTSAALEQANHHKSIFLANMSHELRTPLNAILGFSQLLIDGQPGAIDEKVRLEFLNHIHSSGEHLLALINDILDLSKVEAGQMELRLARTALNSVIESVLSTVAPLAAPKQIQITNLSDPDLYLVADPGKLKQMLLNLISNGIKFTPKGGSVTLHARRNDSMIEIAVTDTGIGLSPGDLQLLFQEFHQIDSGSDRQQEGTGLGLALTKRFASLHGGTISVESVKGLGSTFTLRLPLSPPQAVVALAPLPLGATDPSLPLVLVVENNAQASELLTRHLTDGGFRVEIATTGTEALAKAAALHPVAITLDILLPEIDGWEVLKHLKADPATADIPVVVVSTLDNIELARALGAIDFLIKPVDKAELLASLNRYAFTTKLKSQAIQVLVIDDEASEIDLLETLLTPAGFTVLRALGGADGISMARAYKPHLILLDLRMPGISGFDVVEALQPDPVTAAIPIIILTAQSLTAADRARLEGRVAATFERLTLPNAELIRWLHQLIDSKETP